jgi:hypothetical protein
VEVCRWASFIKSPHSAKIGESPLLPWRITTWVKDKVNFLRKTENGDVKLPRVFCLQQLPAVPHASVRYNLFTAADEKIPLSVVHVNNKPQYLVFSSRLWHLIAKCQDLPVESSKQPSAART